MLDAWLLDYSTREVIRHKFCQHDPRHRWHPNQDTPWSFTIAEDFGDAYAHIFHGMRSPGAGHWLPPVEVDWLRDYLLALEPKEPIWI